jgi:TonB family protein
MKRSFVVAILILLSGCKSLELPEAPETLPQLVYQAPLPPWPESSLLRELRLDLEIYVGTDGLVRDAVLITPTVFSEWNRRALEEVRKWRFSPAMARGKPVPLWIRQTVRVQFEQPMVMVLAEIAVSEAALADSLHRLLESGVPFDTLARRFSVAASRELGGVLGEIDVRTLPNEVRRELVKLQEGEFSEPLVLGQRYVIYKRLKPRSFSAKAN